MKKIKYSRGREIKKKSSEIKDIFELFKGTENDVPWLAQILLLFN